MSEILNNEWLIPILAIAAALLILLLGVLIYRKRLSGKPEQQLQAASADILSHFLIPDGDGGEITVEHALLTCRGIVIVDLKDVEGNIFGSDSMQDWTVIADNRRFTFSNPQYALYDRLAAVRRLVTEVPVNGCIVFTNRGHFSKGQPSDVKLLDALLREISSEHRDEDGNSASTWRPQWDQLREAAVSAQIDHLMRS